MTIVTFDSIESAIQFQGEDYSRAYGPDTANDLFSRWDSQWAHFDVVLHIVRKKTLIGER